MSWVRKTPPPSEGHECKPPMRERVVKLPGIATPTLVGSSPTIVHRDTVPDGAWGDLWRCPCSELWRVGNSCEYCDPRPPGGRCVRGGYHGGGYAWRPATWWQRFWSRGRGYDDESVEQWEETLRWEEGKES